MKRQAAEQLKTAVIIVRQCINVEPHRMETDNVRARQVAYLS
jgi:hypothetical protein